MMMLADEQPTDSLGLLWVGASGCVVAKMDRPDGRRTHDLRMGGRPTTSAQPRPRG